MRLKRPPVELFGPPTTTPANELCFQLSPDVLISLTAQAKAPGEKMAGELVRLVEHRHQGDAMEPYERLLGDALRGDRTLFGSEDGVEAAWRVVDPILNGAGHLCEYERGTWGPTEAERIAADVGGWIVPGVANPDDQAS